MLNPIILIHGGAGTLAPDRLTPEKRQTILTGLRTALEAGRRVLANRGSAIDAVTAAVCALEDDPSFNAGRGSVFTAAGTIEMDAAIMDGATARFGAVAGICGPRNPVTAARFVMEQTPHVLLAGTAAEKCLHDRGLPYETIDYFATDDRRIALQRFLADTAPADDADRHGTVGAVALDHAGALAAATSTGGMTGKIPGRIGDTPIAGAGTWADTNCAVSATGHGESFVRAAAAHEIAARMRLANQDLRTAADAALAAVAALGGDGGLIALDRHGNFTFPFNSIGMYRGMAQGDAPPLVAIHGEPLA